MSQSNDKFKELHKLFEKRLGDLKETYKITTEGIPSAYDIFNSRKVEDVLASRKTHCGRLVPSRVDPTALNARFAVAFGIVQNDRLQNEEPQFCADVQKALNKAKEILAAKPMEAAYAIWFASQQQKQTDAELERIGRAEKERKREEQKRKKIEQELEEARRKEAEAHRRAEAAERREQEARQQEAEARRRAEEAEEQEDEPELYEETERPSTANPWVELGLGVLGLLQGRRQSESTIDISGEWRSYDGFPHLIKQNGNQVWIQAINPFPFPVVMIDGTGTVSGRRISINYVEMAFGTRGKADMEVSANGQKITGTATNFASGRVTYINLYR